MIKMSALYRKNTTTETSDKALRLLKKSGRLVPEAGMDVYAYFLTIQDNTGDELPIDALLSVDYDSIKVLLVWEMTFDAQKGMLEARDMAGEQTVYAKRLAKKYMSAFLFILETTDIDGLNSVQAFRKQDMA